MEKTVRTALRKTLTKAKADGAVLAVMLFGSYVRGEAYRDVDLCLVLHPKARVRAFEKMLEYSSESVDVQVFQALPLYVRKRILKDGRVLLCKDYDALYDIAIKTVKEFELFRPKYKMYLEGVADG